MTLKAPENWNGSAAHCGEKVKDIVRYPGRQHRWRVLLCDADAASRTALAGDLELGGLHVDQACENARPPEQHARLCPDIIVLNVSHQGGDSWRLLARSNVPDGTPIILLRAANQEGKVLYGLDAGADDCIAKPFDPAEVFARIEVTMRSAKLQRLQGRPLRTVARSRCVFEIDDLRRTILAHDDGVHRWLTLTSSEFDLLAHLIRSPGRLFTRRQLLAAIGDETASARKVDSLISTLRSKLRLANVTSIIATIYSKGYSLENDPQLMHNGRPASGSQER